MIARATTSHLPHAVDTLMREHRRIEALLDALERYGERVEGGEPLPPRDLAELIAVLRGYADAHHHAKEEHVLFRAMVAAGVSEEDGPVAFMMEQHDEGRRLIGELAELANDCMAANHPVWTPEATRRIARIARDYTIMLRAHIRDEDEVVYALARARLRPGAWEDVERACAELDAVATTTTATLEAQADALVQRYGRSS